MRPALERLSLPYELTILEQPNQGAAAARHHGIVHAEGALIVRWVTRLLDAARAVTETEEIVLHIYVFDTYDQRVLLDGIRGYATPR